MGEEDSSVTGGLKERKTAGGRHPKTIEGTSSDVPPLSRLTRWYYQKPLHCCCAKKRKKKVVADFLLLLLCNEPAASFNLCLCSLPLNNMNVFKNLCKAVGIKGIIFAFLPCHTCSKHHQQHVWWPLHVWKVELLVAGSPYFQGFIPLFSKQHKDAATYYTEHSGLQSLTNTKALVCNKHAVLVGTPQHIFRYELMYLYTNTLQTKTNKQKTHFFDVTSLCLTLLAAAPRDVIKHLSRIWKSDCATSFIIGSPHSDAQLH